MFGLEHEVLSLMKGVSAMVLWRDDRRLLRKSKPAVTQEQRERLIVAEKAKPQEKSK